MDVGNWFGNLVAHPGMKTASETLAVGTDPKKRKALSSALSTLSKKKKKPADAADPNGWLSGPGK